VVYYKYEVFFYHALYRKMTMMKWQGTG